MLRQSIGNYAKISKKERKETITQLLFAARAKLRSSDIIDEFSAWAALNNYELDSVNDTEDSFSQPDILIKGPEMINYRYLVGPKRVALAYRFVEYAFKGLPIPIEYIKSYLPIIEMIHDFIEAGPTAISQLKVLHKRIKKNKK